MFKYIILSGLMTGLLQLPASSETYTGGVSQEISGADMQADMSEPQQTRVKLRSKLSAVGFHWEGPYHIITYVDPASSVYGIIFPGDREISLNGMDPKQSEIQRKNYGANNTTVDIIFQKLNGERIKLSVLRQPVSNFSAYTQSQLLPYRAR